MRWSCLFKISLTYFRTFCITCKLLLNYFLLRAYMNEWMNETLLAVVESPFYLPILYLIMWIYLVSLYLNPTCWQTQQHYYSFPLKTSHKADTNLWFVAPNVSGMLATWTAGLDHAVGWCRSVFQDQLSKMQLLSLLWNIVYEPRVKLHYEYKYIFLNLAEVYPPSNLV